MIRVAVIGTGVISEAHIKGYLTFPQRCKIVALCDIYPEKAEQKKAKFQLDADVEGDYKTLLAREDIDLVSVCTPPYTHAPISIDFLQAGKHVLVEKPMASSLEECDAMNAAARESGKILSVVSQNRFRDPIMGLKRVLESGLIGKVVHAQVDSFWWRGHNYYDLWWRGTWENEGGGCTLNHAVHHIDMFQWMMGMPEQVVAVMSNTAHDNAEVEDISIALLKYGNGSLGQITSSVVHHGEEQQLVFQGTRARVSAPWKVRASIAKENGFPERNEQLEQELQLLYDETPKLAWSGHTGQIDNVMGAVEGTQSLLIDGNEGRKTLELISAIYQSACTGTSVRLPLKREDPFYTREGILSHAVKFYEKKKTVKEFGKNEITLGSDYQ